MNIEEMVARTLADLKVRTVFGLMGDANMYTLQRFAADGGRYVSAFNESAAVQMALGYASVTGEVGVATATCGPGFTNTLTSLIEGAKAHHPIVVLTGQGRNDRRGFMQNVDQRAFALATGAGFEAPDDMRDVQASLLRAFRRAATELRPIVHELPPYNLLATSDTPYHRCTPDWHVPTAAVVPGDHWDRALGIIATAKRPLVLAGFGAVRAGVKADLQRLAARIGAPLATTLRAKDLFRGSAGNLGLMGVSCRNEVVDALQASDCIIAFGASLNTFTMGEGAYLSGKRVVSFNDCAFDLNEYAIPDVAIQVGLKAAVDQIITSLDAAEIASSGFATEDVVARAHAAIQQRRSLSKEEFNAPDYLTYDKAMQVIDAAVGPRVLVTESGRYKYSVWHNVAVDDPRHFVSTIGYGSIGLALGHAIGAAVAEPDRTVVLAMGDGGFMNAGMAELQTLVNQKLRVLVVVCDDGAYGTEYHKFAERGVDPDFTRLTQPDFAQVAAAMGMRSLRVAAVADLQPLKAAIEQWTDAAPMLIDLVVDTRSVE